MTSMAGHPGRAALAASSQQRCSALADALVRDRLTAPLAAGAFDGAEDEIPIDSSIECERFINIPPGQKRTVCCTPLCGIVSSQMLWPLAHATLEIEWTLCSDPESVVASSTVGNAAAGGAPGNQAIPRSHEWEIQLPRLELNLVQLSSVGDAEFNSLLAGEGLHMDCRLYTSPSPRD